MIQLIANLIAVTALGGAFAAVALAVFKVLISLAATGSSSSPVSVVVCKYCGAALSGSKCENCGAVKKNEQ